MDYSRQEGWFDPSKFKTPVHVIGCGATGSFVALQLVKMGVRNLTVYDFDKVEEHNVANQIFNLSDIGEFKVNAFLKHAKECSDNLQHIKAVNAEVNSSFRFDGIVFVLTDSMSSRKEIWEQCLKYKPGVEMVVETRMGINCGRVYCVNPMKVNQVNSYEKNFYDDTEAEVSFCGSSLSIVPTAMNIGSYAVWCLIKHTLNKENANELLIDLEYNNVISTIWRD